MRVAPSCRDKGRMWGWVGALCLSWWQRDSPGFREAVWSHSHQDKHKAPSSTQPRPLSLQDGGGRKRPAGTIPLFGRQYSSGRGRTEPGNSPIRSAIFIRTGADGARQLPYSVGKNHQDGGTYITGFGRQNSSERQGRKHPDGHDSPIRSA